MISSSNSTASARRNPPRWRSARAGARPSSCRSRRRVPVRRRCVCVPKAAATTTARSASWRSWARACRSRACSRARSRRAPSWASPSASPTRPTTPRCGSASRASARPSSASISSSPRSATTRTPWPSIWSTRRWSSAGLGARSRLHRSSTTCASERWPTSRSCACSRPATVATATGATARAAPT